MNWRNEKKKKIFQMVGKSGDKQNTLKKKPKSWEQKNIKNFQKDGGLERTVQEC